MHWSDNLLAINLKEKEKLTVAITTFGTFRTFRRKKIAKLTKLTTISQYNPNKGKNKGLVRK